MVTPSVMSSTGQAVRCSKKTTRNGDVLKVDSFDEAGFPTLSTSKDRLGYKEAKTTYYAGTRQIHIQAEKEYYVSTVKVYRADSSVEQSWVRNRQTLVIEHLDKANNVVWRQNLLLYRLRLGASAKLSDWRIFTVEDVNSKGAVTRRIIFGKDNTPQLVCFPTDIATESVFEGVLKVLRPDGTVEVVKYHNVDDTEVVKERHSAQENVREADRPGLQTNAHRRPHHRAKSDGSFRRRTRRSLKRAPRLLTEGSFFLRLLCKPKQPTPLCGRSSV